MGAWHHRPVAAYTGPQGELVLNTDDWSLQAHDGVAVGGWVIRPRLNTRTVTATGAQTVGVTDDVIAWAPATPGAATFTLPSGARTGEAHGFKYLATGAPLPTLIIAPAAGTIDGQAQITLTEPYAYVEVVYLGSNQWIVR
jgi:hypothetical protein